MAVTPGYVGSATITWAASTTATVSGQSIGTASADRIVVVAVSIEADFAISSCTIGGNAATAGPNLRNTAATPDISCAFFYLAVPSGTTADIGVTLSGSSSSIGRISVWAMTGSGAAHTDSNTNSGTGTSITLGSVTINAGGAGFWAWGNATNTTLTWTNADVRDNSGAGTGGTAYRHSVADSTTAGTPTVTADGANAQQTIVGMSFDAAAAPPTGGTFPAFPGPRVQQALYYMAVAAVIPATVPAVEEATPLTVLIDGPQVNFSRPLYYQSKIAPPPQVPEVVAPTTVDWVQPLGRAAPHTKLRLSNTTHTLAPISEPYSLFDVRTTYLAVKVLHYQDRFEPIAVIAEDNNQTIDKWLQPLSKAVPRPPVYSAIYTPFVPKEAVLENTVTPDKWLTPFLKAVPHAWPAKQAMPFVRFEAPPVTPAQWMQPFTQAVPALHLNVSQVTYAAPPVAEDNSQTIDKWKLEWNLAAKAPKPIHTQPVFGYPYEGIDNTRREWDWTIQWRGPPNYSPPTISASPFVPKEAVLENTVTPDKWLKPLGVAAKRPPVWATQPFFGYPYISAPTLTTTLEWLRPWQGPPKYKPPRIAAQPFVPREATRENTITGIAWHKPLGIAAKRPVAWPTQPFFGYPYVAAVTQFSVFDVQTSYLARRSIIYQDTIPAPAQPPPPAPVFYSVSSVETVQISTRALFYDEWSILSPYPYEGVVSDEGPADEHERIACVPLASRVAIVPELSRVAEVPINDRDQASNEYRDRTCGTPEAPVAVEPEVPTGEDAPFQDDPFDDDAFQV